jgi:hypothetical protein
MVERVHARQHRARLRLQAGQHHAGAELVRAIQIRWSASTCTVPAPPRTSTLRSR